MWVPSLLRPGTFSAIGFIVAVTAPFSTYASASGSSGPSGASPDAAQGIAPSRQPDDGRGIHGSFTRPHITVASTHTLHKARSTTPVPVCLKRTSPSEALVPIRHDSHRNRVYPDCADAVFPDLPATAAAEAARPDGACWQVHRGLSGQTGQCGLLRQGRSPKDIPQGWSLQLRPRAKTSWR